MIVAVPAEVPVKLVLQLELGLLPATSVQVAGIKLPAAGAILQFTEPVGDPLLPFVSFTVAIQLVEPPTRIEVETHDTVVDVLSFASVNVFCACTPDCDPTAVK